MLASVDFNDDASGVTDKVANVAPDANLTTEMSACDRKATAQMPPKLLFGFGRCGAHRVAKRALRRRHRAVLPGPDSWFARFRFIPFGHVSVSLLRPQPLTT